MRATSNMPCVAPNHKRCDASEIGAVPCEKFGPDLPRSGAGGGDAGGMPLFPNAPAGAA